MSDWPYAIAAGFLFLATAAFVLWQNSQIAVLWDLSYLLDTSWRIALGQMPYRDFPLVHPPLTFLIQAAIMRLAGRHYEIQVAYTALIGGLGTVISWRILYRTLSGTVWSAWAVSILLAVPLTVLGVYSIYPHPIYDCDCAFAILASILLLQGLAHNPPPTKQLSRNLIVPVLTGAAAVVPVFFKQNMGLPFLLAVVAGILLLLIAGAIPATVRPGLPRSGLSDRGLPGPGLQGRYTPSRYSLLAVLAGIALALMAAGALLHVTAGLGNYLHWTVGFAASRRLPGIAPMLAVYRQPSFAWTLPCFGAGVLLLSLPFPSRLWSRVVSFSAFCLLSAPLIGSIVFLILNDDLDERADNLLALWPALLLLSATLALEALRRGVTMSRLIPFFVLAAIHGTFLSQQLWGSTYAIWPLLMLLLAQMVAYLPSSAKRLAPALAVVISATFLVCGGFYAAGRERLNYIKDSDGPLFRATLPALRGMAEGGPYLADFEELVRFADKEIPPQDDILLLPGEEPFYFATGRVPQFPVQIFDETTDPYSPEQLLAEARNRNIRWAIVKTRLQSTENPLPEPERTVALILKEYCLYRHLPGYDIYGHC